MFGDKEKCCCCPPSVSEVMIHVQYAQKISNLENELYRANQVIRDLAETNKHLSSQRGGDCKERND